MKHDWRCEEVVWIYRQPLLDLVHRAATVHRRHHDPRHVQQCSLLSVRTGGCPEDCGYCPQARSPEVQPLLSVEDDRVRLLQQLAALKPHPESVPINALVRVAGTPLADRPPVDPLLVVRMVATARILMPGARVRLSAGRHELHETAQALCFLAGANSIFAGEQLLTTPNRDPDEDHLLAI